MAKIGLLSDSHGRAAITRAAVAILVGHGADLLLHLGDVGGVEVIDALAGVTGAGNTSLEARLVFGNTDGDLPALTRYARQVGVHVDHPVGRLTFDGQTLAFTHGDDATIMGDALAQRVRWLCHGHTHRASDQKQGHTRIINPGALFRAPNYSVALLDTDADRLAFYPVDGAC